MPFRTRVSARAVLVSPMRGRSDMGRLRAPRHRYNRCAILWVPSDQEARKGKCDQLAGGLGFEPRLAESESAVLPLDDPPPGRYLAGGPLPRKASGPKLRASPF